MDSSLGKVKTRPAVFLLVFAQLAFSVNAYNTYLVVGEHESYLPPHIESYNGRSRRDTAAVPPAAAAAAAPPAVGTVPATVAPSQPTAPTDDSNRSVNASTTPPPAVVTQIPLLGRNGTGIRLNITNTPKVSEPIYPDDNITDLFNQSPELVKPQENITNLQEDTHEFYNSTFIGNVTYFNEYWQNITKKKAEAHAVLSNSHRRATTLKLSFDFPFYGHVIQNITVATGGFIYTGEHVHNWLAATQYIAPLMANFDTRLTNDSAVKMIDDGEKFTAFWENVTLQENKTQKFTFAVTLHKNGDIVFAYRNVPIAVQNISDSEHPVKVGISDAYLADRIHFLIRRKTIYEYHRVSFKGHEIASNTILRLTALKTCLPYESCDTCVNHNTGFNCMWCEAIRKCSSGTDRNKQDWLLRNCDKAPISNASSCPARTLPDPANSDATNPAYITEGGQSPHETVIKKKTSITAASSPSEMAPPVEAPSIGSAPAQAPIAQSGSPIGGAVAAFVTVALLCSLGAWALYAFKNPHTRSGQLLIKYRPSQWSWRRGEARYTAATIHM